MKTARNIHTGEQDCSCTSCLYKSPSDNPSLGRSIELGSRIDRLYFGKYIPMRERKLLERLVRTRAVYDDIRAKLISDSTISLSTKAESKKRSSSKDLNDNEKGSGAVFELVNLVDKGATLGLSECCSCCSCTSKREFQEHTRTEHRRSNFGSRRHVMQKHRLDAHHKKKGVRFKAKNIRSDPCTCTFKLSGSFKNNRKSFAKKNIPTESLDLESITNEERPPRRKRVREFARRSYENIKQSNKQIGEKVLEGVKKVKESKTNLQERLQFDAQASAVKLKQTINKDKSKVKTAPPKRASQANLQLNDLLAICMCPEDQIFGKPPKESLLDVYTKKSKETVFKAKNKLKSAMKSTMERKPKITKIHTKTSGTSFQQQDIAFQVKKDSIRKFQEELRRKQIMKDWECDPECIEDCVPEECYIKLKRKPKNIKHRGLEHHITTHERKSGSVLNQKNEKIQNKALTAQAKSTTKKRTGKKKNIKLNAKPSKLIPQKKPSSRQGVRIKSSFSFDVEFFKEKPKMTSKESTLSKPTPSGINYKLQKNRKAQQRNSQVLIKHSSRDTQTEKRSLKRCFCTLKLKSKKSKAKHKKKHTVISAEKSITTFELPSAPCKHVNCSVNTCEKMVCEKLVLKKSSDAHTNTAKFKKRRHVIPRKLLPYECEPGVCTPGNCDPYQCIKLINIREAKLKECSSNCICPSRKTKSTSTFTSRSNKASRAKIAQSLYTYGTTQKRIERIPKIERKNACNPKCNAYGRQAVKIGSTFSFNIEFYKNKPPQRYAPPSDLKTFAVRPKLREVAKPKLKERAYQGDVASFHKNIPTQIYKKERDESISTSLKKCFCTLKLQRKSRSKFKKKKMFSTGTKTIEEPFMNVVTSTKGTKTKQKLLKSLKPYECEPFTCIPGECNPYECLERINRRNLRDVGVSSIYNRSDTNKGSSTSEKSLRAVKTQSKPRSREQKVLTKVNRPKRQTQTVKEKVSYTSSARSKQAVRIGSTFSFNVEFFKNRPQMQDLNPNYQIRPAVKLDNRPLTRNKGVKIVKLNVANLDTQVEELKKRNKTSTTKPLLKRCFCTLNLQKGKNNARTAPLSYGMQPKVYTVNTAMVKQNRLSIIRTKNMWLSKSSNINMHSSLNGQMNNRVIKSLYNECRRLNGIKHLQSQSCYPLITNTDKLETIKSNFNTALKLISQSYIKLSGIENPQPVKESNNLNQISSLVNQERKCIVYTSNNFNGQKRHLSGLGQYLKGYFYSMNFQVVRNKYTQRQRNIYSDVGNQGSDRPRKLKPYECEPGVCIPGECDPYECLKLISKRESNFSKKTGTESTVTSTSSHTRRSPKYRSNKVQSPSQKTTEPHVTRVYQDQHNLGEKKAVRVGSTFSFDIEFFKNSGSPQIVTNKIPKLSSATKPSYPKRTKSYLSKTTGINKRNFRNRYSQSAFSKTLQKASATLPRMKRCFCTLKLQKKGRIPKKEHMQPSEGMQTEALFPQTTTIDRGHKAPKFKPLKVASLKPYQCPPGICTPGLCNPHECLEIMKKLNYNQTSDSGTDAIIGDSKSSASMTTSDRKHRNRKVYAKPRVASKISLSEPRQKKRVQPSTITNPNKQVVRIGSSFSFNIEFHKSQPSLDHPTDNVPTKPPRRFQYRMSDLKKRHIKFKQRSSETSTAKRHKQSQIRSTAQAASTMTTSFMKRCFCVLQLRKNKKNKTDDTNVVKNKPVNMDKKTNTKHYKERMLQLEPYECEPGICIPGECDPYVCEKFIKRRNNSRSKSSSTGFNSTRSASSSSPPIYTKNINTQFRPNKTTRETEKQVYTKTKVRDSNRQVVKIGSNFSFDIEFYKNKTSKLKDYDIPRHIKKEMLRVRQNRKKVKNSGTRSPSVSFRSQISQMKVNKRDFAAGINNVIKRCFCTLQLYNQRLRKDGKRKENKIKPVENMVHSKSVMTTEKNKINLNLLQPYECEPNICVPGECDPYECEKLIKLRQKKQLQREIGMSTQHLSKQSAASSTEPFKRSRKRTQSIALKNKEHVKKVKSFNRVQEAQSKQCVKIGSSFSFNIEFFKNKNAGLQLVHKPQYRQPKLTAPKANRRTKTKTQALQSQNSFHSSPSQMENQFMKTQSTMARFTPPLKRCFCTFYLRKPQKEPVSIPKPIMSDVSTETKLHGPRLQTVAKLLPYECEPNICIPGECNPLECLERIKARQKQQKNYGTSTQHLRRNEFGSSMDGTKTKNRRSQFKSVGHVKRKTQKQQKQVITNHPNKQAVRIGSNFSFSIDFYKQRGSDHFEDKVSNEYKHKYGSKPLNKTHKNKQVNKKIHHNMQRNRGSQSRYIIQSSKSTAAEPFFKRCFCTLKLKKKPATKISKTKLKSDNIEEVSHPKIVSKDRGTLTKKYKNKVELLPYECEPFTCIPGECDPYECQKRIEARNRKAKNISTQMLDRLSQKSVGMNLENMNSKKTQSNQFSNLPNKSKDNQANIVEIPRFGNLFNKQAVKIGSNFSFNIEFYKEIIHPTAETHSECDKVQCYKESRPKAPKKYTDSTNTSTVAKHHNKAIQGYGVKTDNKALEVGNALKRCFCTLKLQKELKTKRSKLKIQNPQYPQIVEVRRVSIKKNTKQTFTQVRSVGTKTKKKYFVAECNSDTCRDYKTLDSQEMEVILPYTPTKFNKTPSKTIQNKELYNKTNTKPRKTSIANRGKRLTRKKSKNHIRTEHFITEDLNAQQSHHSLSNLHKLICKCAQIFGHKTEPKNLLTQLNGNDSSKNKIQRKVNKNKTTTSDRLPHRDNYDLKYNKSVDLKHKHSRKCYDNCPYQNQNIDSRYQAGDVAQNPTMSLKMIKKNQMDTLDATHEKDKENITNFLENSLKQQEGFFCSHCIENIKMNKRRSQPLKVHFQDSPTPTKNNKAGRKTKAKDGLALLNKSVDHIDKHRRFVQKNKMKTDIQSRKLAKYCMYCTTCGVKLNNEEFKKAAGDQKSLKSETKSAKFKNLFRFKQSVDNICTAEAPEPLFEMRLDSDDYEILNKDEVLQKVKQFKKDVPKKHKPHDESCRCCICISNRSKTGATIYVSPKGRDRRTLGNLFGGTLSAPSDRQCVCGSELCAEELAKMVKESYRPKKKHAKPCDCGSPICALERKTINAIAEGKDKVSCDCAKERAKRMSKLRAKENELKRIKRAKRLKKYEAEDKIRIAKRHKRNKQMEKKLNKSGSDCVLLSESLIDIGKFGITACTDILRLVARTATDPKQAYQNLKDIKENPELLSKMFSSGFKDSGISSTCRRIRLRCLSMQGIKNIRNVLERYALTNYLLYIFHKDPTKRILKKRREREQLDFNCSLYMGSLRKRPHLSVYNRCPWFYPHFLSLLNVWKQFMEVTLFLVAVVVWSPCILCMEACRAFMCCFFCTG